MNEAKLRELAAAASPNNGKGNTSRDIDPQNPVWGPLLKAFKDAVWPEDVTALLDENERMRAFLDDVACDGCAYNDNCPSNARHYVCLPCKAKRVLATVKESP